MERLAQGGSNSTAEFVQDLILKLHDIFLKYSISIQATSMFSVQMGRRSEEATEQIQLARDLQSGLAALGGIRDSPSPVLYQNYYHGPSKDLIFDVSLQDYAFARGIGGDPNIIPIIVDKCIRGIEDRGLEAEGLYRISPRLSTVQTLVHKIEIDEESFQFPRTEEIYTIAAILKLYLRRLPEPPFRWSLSERLAYSKEREDHIGNDFIVIRTKLKRMPAIHVATLRAVILHLCKVVVADNKMDAKNLSIIFSSILFGEEGQGLGRDGVKDVDIQTLMQASKDVFFEDLLIYAPIIFEDNGDIRPSSRLTPRSSPHQSHIYSPPLTQGSQFGPPQQSGLGRSNTINASAITPPNRFGLPARTRSGSVNLPPANLRFSPSGRNDFGSGFKFRRQPSFQSGTSTPDRPRETPDIDEYTTASTLTPTPTPTPPRLPPRKSSTSNSLTSIAIPTSPPAVAAESDATIPRITDSLPPLIINQPMIDRGPHNVSLHPNPPSGPNHLELSTGNLIVPTPVDSGAISPGLANLAYLSQAAEKVIEEQASTDETSDAKVLSKSSSSD
ncbi:Predicted Rho GTPase-activating protein [Phaffia rhodozyma]|uniref:Predicted Rho GTPase-activating protein n=1 Tax=Phaffia rhodozyma TaxID=264483 RepID=A0A0F7SWK8_PHARH|nr:Predicted Rho GTPase-activating protein [Phaffia rhodozyma]